MIISHKHKFIFIHTKKTAGTYVSMLLASVCGDGDIIAPYNEEDSKKMRDIYGIESRNYIIPLKRWKIKDYVKLTRGKGFPIFRHHMPTETVRKYLGKEVWNSYYKFCFEREPIDKVFSYIRWRNRDIFFDKIEKYEEFVTNELLEKLKKGGSGLYMREGVVQVDKIFKYENIDQEIERIERILGVRFKRKGFTAKETRKVPFSVEDALYRISEEKVLMIYRKFYWEYNNIYKEEKRKIENIIGL